MRFFALLAANREWQEVQIRTYERVKSATRTYRGFVPAVFTYSETIKGEENPDGFVIGIHGEGLTQKEISRALEIARFCGGST